MNRPHTSNNRKSFRDDERGAAVPIQYVIGFAILLIVSGTFVGGARVAIDNQHDAIVNEETERISIEVASAIETTDARIGQAHEQNQNTPITADATTRVSLPETIAGESYTISTNSTGYLIVRTDDITSTIELDTNHVSGITTTSVGDGDVIVTYDESSDTIGLKSP